jgi:hypothetical protein
MLPGGASTPLPHSRIGKRPQRARRQQGDSAKEEITVPVGSLTLVLAWVGNEKN